MNAIKLIIAAFGITATAAGLLALILKPFIVFIVWLVIFFAICVVIVLKHSKLFIGYISNGYISSLDMINQVIKKGIGQEVFIYAAFNIPTELEKHQYMSTMTFMLQNAKFDEYTRIATLRNEGDRSIMEKLIQNYGKSAKVKLGVYDLDRSFPLDILTVSPNHVILGFPRRPTINISQGNVVSIYIKSKILYNGFSMLREFLWEKSNKLSDNQPINDYQIKEIIKRLYEISVVKQEK